ncbi:MAG: hypothetical protein M0007_08310 [Actinomycetota bacterium]|jgi:hypothetical protein|nr:hypothetical protein [Actinomycetota bacterium]
MTQPSFVPIVESDQVRPAYRLHTPEAWMASRPSELHDTRPPAGRAFGHPGPDQGYALKLVRSFEGRLTLAPGESEEDALAGCAAVAMRRAATFGRAPVVFDLDFACLLYGYLGDAPADLVADRVARVRSAAHHQQVRLALADRVAPGTYRLMPDEVADQVAAGEWRSLFSGDGEVAAG